MLQAAALSTLDALGDGPLGQLDVLAASDAARRLNDRDSSLWSDDPEVGERIVARLGWIGSQTALPRNIATAGGSVLLLGMGGSSLGALACAEAFGSDRLRVLDSTVPGAVAREIERLHEVSDVVVASKSGGTIETLALADRFESLCGSQAQFHAITDPGTALEARARVHSYATCTLNPADIGGRFAVLSAFGMVPATLAGIEADEILRHAATMAERCRGSALGGNPGLWLAAVLAAALRSGRDKLSLLAAPRLEGLADWIEQLVAESTGKDGRGILPITRESIPMLDEQSEERLVVSLEWDGVGIMDSADLPPGVPVVRFRLPSPAAIGAEFYRWQFAVAALGATMRINPFDEPDVASAKKRTTELLEVIEAGGELPQERPDWSGEALQLFGSGEVAGAADEVLAPLLFPQGAAGYVAILAFLSPADMGGGLAELRRLLARSGAVTLGWGPRYLHSSGQFHKGGPGGGRFLVITGESPGVDDPLVPNRSWSLGTLATAQARGDVVALRSRSRPVVHAHFSGEVEAGCQELIAAIGATVRPGDRCEERDE